MIIKEHDIVETLVEKNGVPVKSKGAVVHIHENGEAFEVEFNQPLFDIKNGPMLLTYTKDEIVKPKKLTVCYWHHKLPKLDYVHNTEFEYSEEKRNEIINEVLSKNYSVMIRPLPTQNAIVIWIDEYRFGQR